MKNKRVALVVLFMILGAVFVYATDITVPDKVTGDKLTGAEFTQILDALKSGTRTITTQGVISSGRVDGLVGLTLSTAGSPTTISSTNNKVAFYLNQGNSEANSVYTLPTAAAGLQYCVRNYTGIVQPIKFQTSAAGQYIDLDGTNTASGKAVKSSGALADSACVVGVDATHWILFQQCGTWTIDNL